MERTVSSPWRSHPRRVARAAQLLQCASESRVLTSMDRIKKEAGGIMAFSKRSWMLGLGALGFLGCGGADWEQPAQESDTAAESAELKGKTFLSLGNSIAFGFNPLVAPTNPSNYVGYPEVLASLGNKVTNAACPGETSSSFLSATAADNGCRDFKKLYALHSDYETTQIAFTVSTLKKKSFDYVTLDL